MLLRSDAGGVLEVVLVGASGGGSADAARAGGDPARGLAGEELRLLALGATCSKADPKPGRAYGANLCALLSDGAGDGACGTGGGGKEYCWSNGCRLNSRPGGI
jgi:hypothetical protein